MIVLGYNGFSRSHEVLGISREGIDRNGAVGHDAGAAIVIDGRVVAAVEQERFNRQKKTTAFPLDSITWCLAQTGLSFDDIDYFAFPWSVTPDVLDEMKADVAALLPDPEYKPMAFAAMDKIYQDLFAPERVAAEFQEFTGYAVPAEKLVRVPHHLAHMMTGYQVRGGGDTAFFISDGRAERNSAIAGTVEDGRITVFEPMTVHGADSVGLFYSHITGYLGFLPNNDEYKVMGLSAFCSEPTSRTVIDAFVTLLPDGGVKFVLPLDTPASRTAYVRLFDRVFGANDGNRTDFDFQARVARVAQDLTESVTAHQVAALAKRTALPNLVFEGGLALNCVNNTKLLEAGHFSSVDVSFGASDTGLPIGAAAYVGMTKGGIVPQPCSTYLGPEFTHEQMLAAVREFGAAITFTEIDADKLTATVADILTEKVVIGWFQGRAEHGPRALGSRSILANPVFEDIKDIINVRVKHREPFRPFAPLVLESDAPDLFELGKLTTSPFMTFVVPVKDEFRAKINGATHVDGTSRVQTVNSEQNPLVTELLREVKARTGVGCLINTSFNVAGEPIVGSPADAIHCFLGTEIDYLVLGRLLIRKAE